MWAVNRLLLGVNQHQSRYRDRTLLPYCGAATVEDPTTVVLTAGATRRPHRHNASAGGTAHAHGYLNIRAGVNAVMTIDYSRVIIAISRAWLSRDAVVAA